MYGELLGWSPSATSPRHLPPPLSTTPNSHNGGQKNFECGSCVGEKETHRKKGLNFFQCIYPALNERFSLQKYFRFLSFLALETQSSPTCSSRALLKGAPLSLYGHGKISKITRFS